VEEPTSAAKHPCQAACAQRTTVDPDDELILPKHKRVIAAYSSNAAGATELHLHYGEKEILFDEPELFAFGEGLARQSRFVARTAASWGAGYDWLRVRTLLETLLEEGVLRHARATEPEAVAAAGARRSPLPRARASAPRTWIELEAITGELTGRPLELGYLESIVPVYRIAHPALDTEGRQVGEANVFPMQLRLDVPTEWRTCPYAGSRYQDDLPMNVTALRSMSKHWKHAMAALLRIRDSYLRRFPRARAGWTVGDLQRVSSLALTLPAYLLMRAQDRVENGELHAVLSSLYRVVDGVRMTMHRMLFTSVNEPFLSPEAPMTAAEIYAYAERNTVFLSDHGVCAGPKAMIEEFLRVLVDGQPVEHAEAAPLDAHAEAALAQLDPAFDYCLHGLQAYAVVFSLWPEMARAYERLMALAETWPEGGSGALLGFRERLRRSVRFLRSASRMKTEEHRIALERAYADMYAQCASGLGSASSGLPLAERIAPVGAANHAGAAARLRSLLHRCSRGTSGTQGAALDSLTDALMDYFRREQATVRAASEIQSRINQLLGRTPPVRPLTGSDLALHYRLVSFHYPRQQLQDLGGRLPYLGDELEGLGLRAVVTGDAIEICGRGDP